MTPPNTTFENVTTQSSPGNSSFKSRKPRSSTKEQSLKGLKLCFDDSPNHVLYLGGSDLTISDSTDDAEGPKQSLVEFQNSTKQSFKTPKLCFDSSFKLSFKPSKLSSCAPMDILAEIKGGIRNSTKQSLGEFETRPKLCFKKRQVVYTRWEHGNDRVEVLEGEGQRVYEVGGRFYKSASALLKAVTGNPTISTTFDRYFRLGKYGSSRSRPNLLRLLGEEAPVVVDGQVGGLRRTQTVVLDETPEGDEGLVGELVAELDRQWAFFAEGVKGPELGIDLARRGHEVRKLLFAGFRGKMMSRGYDPEDVLQEVYRGLLTRNAGTCPWDGRKATFGYYVHMVINCVLTNYHRKMERRQDREYIEVGDVVGGLESGEWGPEDAVADRMARESLDGWLRMEGGAESALARELLPLVVAGMKRRDLVRMTGRSEGAVAKALAWLRAASKRWAEEVGMR